MFISINNLASNKVRALPRVKPQQLSAAVTGTTITDCFHIRSRNKSNTIVIIVIFLDGSTGEIGYIEPHPNNLHKIQYHNQLHSMTYEAIK